MYQNLSNLNWEAIMKKHVHLISTSVNGMNSYEFNAFKIDQ